jgi:kinesin family protein 2/24
MGPKKSSVVDNVEKMKREREERRKMFEDQKANKKERDLINMAAGRNIDSDYDLLMEKYKLSMADAQPHKGCNNVKIAVCVRKRPIFQKEEANGEIDCVSAANPRIVVHDCKVKVDGITKFVENHNFVFENSFSHEESNEDCYRATIQPNIHFPFNRGIVTCFAYGQTGSGKTHSMKGSNEAAISDLFTLSKT